MSDYSKKELQQLIDRYQRDFMEQYASSLNAPTPATVEDVTIPSEPIETMTELTDIGRLQIRASTENQAVPIIGAVVTVTDANKNTSARILTTDQSGLTPIIELPTKDRQLSLSPDNASPYETYNVIVSADGYFTKEFLKLPIYGGVTAIQNVIMIPVPEGGDNDLPLVYEETLKE